jgi:serine phosphatase RsbU (regulator of sigma subunit)
MNVVWFTAVAMASSFTSASIAVASLRLAGLTSSASVLLTWWTWWLGDAGGILVATPLLITFLRMPISWSRARATEAIALLTLLLAITGVAFGTGKYPFPYIVLPVLIIIALRFRQVGAALAIAVVAFIGSVSTAHGHGPFSNRTYEVAESLLLFCSFIVLNGLTILTLAAARAERETERIRVMAETKRAIEADHRAQLVELHSATIRVEHERERRELQEATALQISMLPVSLPSVAGFEVAGRMQSVREVGGDYYNVLPISDGQRSSHLLCVADVSGKGLAASLMMSNFQAMLITLADQYLRLGEIASRLSARMRGRPDSRYVTSIMVQLDPLSTTAEYVNAGHPDGIIVGVNGEMRYLPSTKRPMGLFPEVEHAQHSFTFEEGDMLALSSDGFADAMDEDGKEFGEARLQDYLLQVRLRPVAEIVSGAFEAVNRFTGSAEQFDDITLLVVKRTQSAA